LRTRNVRKHLIAKQHGRSWKYRSISADIGAHVFVMLRN